LICVANLQGMTLDQSCSDKKTFSNASVQQFVSLQFENLIMNHDTDKVIFVVVATVVITEEEKK